MRALVISAMSSTISCILVWRLEASTWLSRAFRLLSSASCVLPLPMPSACVCVCVCVCVSVCVRV